MRKTTIAICFFLACLTSTYAGAEDSPAIQAIQNVGAEGKGHKEATKAWQEISQLPAAKLTAILAGMDNADALAQNWLRAAVDAIAQRTVQAGDELPMTELKAFLADKSHAPRARRTAFEWIIRVEPESREPLLNEMLNDPSLELRRDAVAQQFEKAKKQSELREKSNALAAAKIALNSARNITQVKAIAQFIRDQGGTVELVEHFGFLTDWHVIAPFDNAGTIGFDVAYAPEKKVSLSATLTGKNEKEIQWRETSTKDEFGMVDLNEVIGKEKGAIAYAYTEFYAKQSRPAELRLGCINANKIWLNGELLTRNEVYHANTLIDQYVGKGKLKKGKNTILIKVAQNEQEEAWAQRWQFQLRVCDELGTPIPSADEGSAGESSK